MWQTWHEASSAASITYRSLPPSGGWGGQGEDTAEGGGVRVPRRPVAPRDSAGAALDLPRATDPAPTFRCVI